MFTAIATATSTRYRSSAPRAQWARTRVRGINSRPRTSTRRSTASRARTLSGNQRHGQELAADHIKYLQPEPKQQDPDFIAIRAERGQSVQAYSYANNNPLAFIDSNGLYSWRAACGPVGFSGERGFVVQKDDVFGIRFSKNNGMVGFDGQGQTACQDLKFAKDMRRYAQQLSLTDYAAFVTAGDCWDALIAEIDAACRKEMKKKIEPKLPPNGYVCSQ